MTNTSNPEQSPIGLSEDIAFGTNTTPLIELENTFGIYELLRKGNRGKSNLTIEDIYNNITTLINMVLDGREGETGMQRLLDSITKPELHEIVARKWETIKMQKELEAELASN